MPLAAPATVPRGAGLATCVMVCNPGGAAVGALKDYEISIIRPGRPFLPGFGWGDMYLKISGLWLSVATPFNWRVVLCVGLGQEGFDGNHQRLEEKYASMPNR